MHSSRMRTARLLPVSPSMHSSGGGLVVYLPRGCVLTGGVPEVGVPARGGCTYLGDVTSQGVYLLGVYLLGVYLGWVYLPGGVYLLGV